MADQSSHESGKLFSSPRERRLWTLAGLVALGIGATLGLAQGLADRFSDQRAVDGMFGLGMMVVVVALLSLAVRARPTRWEIGAWLGVAAVYGLVLVRIASAADRTHLIEYGVLAAVIHEALRAPGRMR